MKFADDQKFFVFDVESVGLHGQAFAVAGGIYDIRGNAMEGTEFAFHHSADKAGGGPDLPMVKEDREWVAENVVIRADSLDVGNSTNLRQAFWAQWKKAKALGALMFVECGWPVEGRFLNRCIEEISGNIWNGPYPLHEIATLMLAADMDTMATYERTPEESPAHEPLADARLSARLLATAILRIQKLNELAGV